MTSYNGLTVGLKIKRADLCNLLIATTSLHIDTGAEKWKELHDVLRKALDDFDEKHIKELER